MIQQLVVVFLSKDFHFEEIAGHISVTAGVAYVGVGSRPSARRRATDGTDAGRMRRPPGASCHPRPLPTQLLGLNKDPKLNPGGIMYPKQRVYKTKIAFIDIIAFSFLQRYNWIQNLTRCWQDHLVLRQLKNYSY